jgi:oxygen-independent coproporphyrinogen-3 oxidase
MIAADLARYFARLDGDPMGGAFPSRRAVMPWRGARPLAVDEIPEAWFRLMSGQASGRDRVAYIHVPFCANHCLFCGFYRNAHTPQAASAYADLVIAEIAHEAGAPAVRDRPVGAVYLGGGTPSALSATDLARVLGTARRELPLADDCEITVEGRIIHFDAEKIDACVAAGANRISIGVQSFDTAVRRRQGRRSDREAVIAFLAGIRARPDVVLVVDLLFGLPGQTGEVWREDLRIAADLAPDGIDLYGLNLIPGTPLHAAAAAGKLRPFGLREMGAMYRSGAEFLAARGWSQISNSHWARTPRERNRYNLSVKAGAECLAYGSGAGGSIGRYGYGLSGALQTYRDEVSAGRKPLDAMTVSDDLQPLRDYVAAGFEVGRLDLGGLGLPRRREVMAPFSALLEQWQAAGLVVLSGDVAHLTTAGRFWYGNLIAAFGEVIGNSVRAGTQPHTV